VLGKSKTKSIAGLEGGTMSVEENKSKMEKMKEVTKSIQETPPTTPSSTPMSKSTSPAIKIQL